MAKVKCSKCGYLNTAEDPMCGMCGELFKKKETPSNGKEALAKPAQKKAQKSVDAGAKKVAVKEKPGPIPEIVTGPKSKKQQTTPARLKALADEGEFLDEPGGLTMEAVERKMNEMLADIKEKVTILPPDGYIPNMSDIKKVVENQLRTEGEQKKGKGDGGLTRQQVDDLIEKKLSAALKKSAPPVEDFEKKIDSQVRKILEENSTREFQEPAAIEAKIAELVDKKITGIKPSPKDAALEADAVQEQIQSAFEEKLGGTEFSLLVMEIAREALDEALPKEHLTGKDVEQIVKTCVETFEKDLLGSDALKKMVQEISPPPAEPEIDLSQVSATLEGFRKELDEKLSAGWKVKLGSRKIAKMIKEVAKQAIMDDMQSAVTKEAIAEVFEKRLASGDVAEDIRHIAQKAAQEAAAAKMSSALEEIESKITEMGGNISQMAQKAAEEAAKAGPTPEEVESKITETAEKSLKEFLSSMELQTKVEKLARTVARQEDMDEQPKLLKQVDKLMTNSLAAAVEKQAETKKFKQAVIKLAEAAAVEVFASEPRLSPDDVSEIAAGQFDKWIDTYFKSQDFKDKVTEHIRSVTIEMLRDARSVMLEDAEIRATAQIETRLSKMEFISPSDLSQKVETVESGIDKKLKEAQKELTASVEEKVSSAKKEFEAKIASSVPALEKMLGETVKDVEKEVKSLKKMLDETVKEVKNEVKPLKKMFNELSDEIDSKTAPLYEQFKKFIEVERHFTKLEKDMVKLTMDAASSTNSMEENLKALDKRLATMTKETQEAMESVLKLVKAAEGPESPLEKKLNVLTERLIAVTEETKKKLGEIESRMSSVTPVDSDSIERMIISKVGDLPREVELFQKRLASLAEESLSSGGSGGLTHKEVARIIEERLAEAGASPDQEEVAAQVDTQLSDLLASEQFKDAVVASVPLGTGGGDIDREQIEQGLRALVQLEAKRLTESTKKMVSEMAASGGGSGADPAQVRKVVLGEVKKALDSKEINLKVAQKFLEVMTYVKSEVPKLVADAVKKASKGK